MTSPPGAALADRIEEHPHVLNVERTTSPKGTRYLALFDGTALPGGFAEFYGLEFAGAWIDREPRGWIELLKHGPLGPPRMKAVFETEVRNDAE